MATGKPLELHQEFHDNIQIRWHGTPPARSTVPEKENSMGQTLLWFPLTPSRCGHLGKHRWPIEEHKEGMSGRLSCKVCTKNYYAKQSEEHTCALIHLKRSCFGTKRKSAARQTPLLPQTDPCVAILPIRFWSSQAPHIWNPEKHPSGGREAHPTSSDWAIAGQCAASFGQITVEGIGRHGRYMAEVTRRKTRQAAAGNGVPPLTQHAAALLLGRPRNWRPHNFLPSRGVPCLLRRSLLTTCLRCMGIRLLGMPSRD